MDDRLNLTKEQVINAFNNLMWYEKEEVLDKLFKETNRNYKEISIRKFIDSCGGPEKILKQMDFQDVLEYITTRRG